LRNFQNYGTEDTGQLVTLLSVACNQTNITIAWHSTTASVVIRDYWEDVQVGSILRWGSQSTVINLLDRIP